MSVQPVYTQHFFHYNFQNQYNDFTKSIKFVKTKNICATTERGLNGAIQDELRVSQGFRTNSNVNVWGIWMQRCLERAGRRNEEMKAFFKHKFRCHSILPIRCLHVILQWNQTPAVLMGFQSKSISNFLLRCDSGNLGIEFQFHNKRDKNRTKTHNTDRDIENMRELNFIFISLFHSHL